MFLLFNLLWFNTYNSRFWSCLHNCHLSCTFSIYFFLFNTTYPLLYNVVFIVYWSIPLRPCLFPQVTQAPRSLTVSDFFQNLERRRFFNKNSLPPSLSLISLTFLRVRCFQQINLKFSSHTLKFILISLEW